MISAAPTPVSAPETMRIGVVGGGSSSSTPTNVSAMPARTGQIGRVRSAIQPAGRRASRTNRPSATKNRPMFAPAASARCGM